MAVAASIAATGHWDWELCLASLPVGLFIALYLHEKEMYRLPIDRRAGATTLALLLGFEGSKIYYVSLVLMGYAGIAGMVILNLIPNWTMLSYLSIPLAVRNFRLLRRVNSPLSPNLTELRRSTATLHVTFGFFYISGFLTEILL
jgi:1,4-dihydroxy-2-naphthoate octaprenyltransferase